MLNPEARWLPPLLRGVCCALLYLCCHIPIQAWAVPLPVVFVIDAALDSADWTTASEITLETSSQLPDDTAFSIVIYDDVIQKVVPLGIMGTERLALIKQTLDNAVTMPTSNLAAGIERAQDELDSLPTGHIILFTSAQITTRSDDKRAQYLEWYKDVLLPDAAQKPLTLTFVTQSTPETNLLLRMALSYQNSSVVAIQPGADAANTLMQLLHQDETTAAVDIVSNTNSHTSVTSSIEPPSDPVQSGPETPIAVATPEPAESATTSAISVTGPATGAIADPIAGAVTDTQAQASKTDIQKQPGLLGNRRLLLMIWYACLALVLATLCGWIIWSQRRRKLARDQTRLSEHSQTGSAYLPLNEMPSRRFDALADAIDDLKPYEQWTAQPRTARNADAPAPTGPPSAPGNKK